MNNTYKIAIFYILIYLGFTGTMARSNPDGSIYFLSLLPAFIYVLPSIIARNKRKFKTIFLINIFLGVSGIGWILALVMAISPEKEPEKKLL